MGDEFEIGGVTRDGPKAPRWPSRGQRFRCYTQLANGFAFYREAVAQVSPGLPRSGYPGENLGKSVNPERVL